MNSLSSAYPYPKLMLCVLVVMAAPKASLLAQEEKAAPRVPTIHITADPLARDLLSAGSAASVMDSYDLSVEGESTLGETIGHQPGVHSSFFGKGASRPVVRGFSGERVRVMRNGIATHDVSSLSEDHVVTADPLEADSVEVLRGPETLLFGSSAIGGAVNVVDESIPEERAEKPFSGVVQGRLGSATDEEKSFSVKLRGSAGPVQTYVSGFHRETEDYTIPGFAESDRLRELEAEEAHMDDFEHDDEQHHEEAHHEEEGHVYELEHDDDHLHEESENRNRVVNSDTRTKGTTLGASYVGTAGMVGASFSYFDSLYGVPGHAHGEEAHGEPHEEHEVAHELDFDEGHDHDEDAEEDVRIDARQYRFDLKGIVQKPLPGVDSLRMRLGYSDYEHDELEGSEIATTYENDSIEGRVELIHSLVDGGKGAIGLQNTYTEFSATGEEAFVVPTDTYSPALFAFQQLPLSPNLRLELGSRIEYVRHTPDSFADMPNADKDFLPVSVSAGPVWDIFSDESYTAGLSFSYTQRAPAPVELYSDGAHLARQIVERGDQNLDLESAWGVDLSLRKNHGVLQSSFTPFVQNFHNYINLAATDTEEEGFPVFRYEEVDAVFWGAEFETTFYLSEVLGLLHHEIDLGLQLDYTRARNTSDSDDIPRIPPLRTIVRTQYEYRERIGSSIEAVFVDSQDKITSGELPTDSYVLLKAEAHLHLPVMTTRELSLFVRGNNLLDEEARVHSSFLKDLAPLPGRSFVFGVRGAF